MIYYLIFFKNSPKHVFLGTKEGRFKNIFVNLPPNYNPDYLKLKYLR